MRFVTLLLTLYTLPVWAQYSVERNGDVVRLVDARSQTTVSILTSVGNTAFDMTIKGANVLRFPFASVDEFKKRPTLCGIPFLGPWANRLDEQAFYANGKKYLFNMELGNVRGKIPIHGFLTYVPEWRVIEARADRESAWITSRLEFWRQPAWMAQWPFAHTIEITYRLQGGVLEVATRVENLSAEPMPLAIGYHPYFQLTDSQRDEWTISVGAHTEWLLSPGKLPTGETRPIEQTFPDPQAVPLQDYDLDHVFSDLVRDASGRAVMSVRGKSQKLEVVFGPSYRAAVIYAPNPNAAAPGRGPTMQNRNFICFEPMVGISNALNLAQKGVYRELQSIPPGGVWRESFWIRANGF
jgi:aldose 1-epimerase